MLASHHNTNHIPKPNPKELKRFHMIVDGNQHRSDLCSRILPFTQNAMLCEALIPQIRLIACMIAAERLYDTTGSTPHQITTEADWFAARILALQARIFHLDVSLIPMFKLANQRAKKFAEKHHIPFVPAQMRMSLHSNRPNQMLIIELEDCFEENGMIQNSLMLARIAQSRLKNSIFNF